MARDETQDVDHYVSAMKGGGTSTEDPRYPEIVDQLQPVGQEPLHWWSTAEDRERNEALVAVPRGTAQLPEKIVSRVSGRSMLKVSDRNREDIRQRLELSDLSGDQRQMAEQLARTISRDSKATLSARIDPPKRTFIDDFNYPNGALEVVGAANWTLNGGPGNAIQIENQTVQFAWGNSQLSLYVCPSEGDPDHRAELEWLGGPTDSSSGSPLRVCARAVDINNTWGVQFRNGLAFYLLFQGGWTLKGNYGVLPAANDAVIIDCVGNQLQVKQRVGQDEFLRIDVVNDDALNTATLQGMLNGGVAQTTRSDNWLCQSLGPPAAGRIMSSLVGGGGLAARGGIAGQSGGLAA